MITMSLKALAKALDVSVPDSEVKFRGITIDSRKNCDGQLFIAIKGERFDAHDYVEAAYRSGAVAALVEHRVDCAIPQIEVANCKKVMIELARRWRRHCSATVIALTGSNGKTTVKEMVSHILHKQAPTHATQGNFNNDIGVPLTLFELSPEHSYAVIELGANHRGEIANLASIAEPDIVYVNNVAAAHLTGFGNVQGVIETKGELYEYCQPQHTAVFNNDEVATAQWRDSCVAKTRYSCALDSEADVTALWKALENGLQLTVGYQARTGSVSVCIFGEHNARNALAAITIAMSAGVEFDAAVKGLEGFSGVKGRLQMVGGPHHSRIINDSYNANPGSLEAGIKVLCSLQGEAWLALGDMGELGDDAEGLHIQAAQTARRLGVKKMFGLGPLSCRASENFDEDGFCFESIDEMAEEIRKKMHQNVNLLVKGSRVVGMERLVEKLLNHDHAEGRLDAL
ncbi:MAG: UDP-N-acetylmuramoyl-tripeptide--D-alanyl-D-alanine ligase [Gammaproteobacteria bacterium]|nr:UDP-N-acetylmuramoyl-tripeptide--D-alanyl-D-alanine ligase [Gammaproteobacteria bacterium]